MAKVIDIVVPDLGDFEDVEVIELLVGVGSVVDKEDGLITLETDKAAMDVPAPDNGEIEELTVAVGDKVNTGSVIGKLRVAVTDTVVIAPAIQHEPTGDTTVLAAPPKKEGKSAGLQTLVVPDLGDFEDVEVIEVHVNKGDEISIDDPLVTLETDKAAMDVPATAAGRIEDVLIRIGDKVSAGTSLAIVDAVETEATPDEQAAATPAPADPAPAPAAAPAGRQGQWPQESRSARRRQGLRQGNSQWADGRTFRALTARDAQGRFRQIR